MIAKWLGRRAAEIVMLLRDKPFIPCQIEWDYRGGFVDVLTPSPYVEDGGYYVGPNTFRNLMDLGDDHDISVDTLGGWGKSPRTPKQGWPCE